MTTPIVSVVVPTCRRPDFLTRCLECLRPGVQSLSAEQYEVIVSDDGEPEDAAAVRRRFPWVRWTAGPRRGPAANRNHGASLAVGRWVAFTDDDCVPGAEWLAAFVEAAEGKPDDVRGTPVFEGKTTCEAGVRSPMQQAPVNLTGGSLWSCNFMILREVFQTLDGFDEEYRFPYMEDIDLHERLIAVGYTPQFVPDAVVDHPPRPTLSGRRLARQHESWIYHWYKSGRRTWAGPRLVFLILKSRLHVVRQHPISMDTFRAIGSLLVEMPSLILRVPFWEWTYRRRFINTRGPDCPPSTPGPSSG